MSKLKVIVVAFPLIMLSMLCQAQTSKDVHDERDHQHKNDIKPFDSGDSKSKRKKNIFKKTYDPHKDFAQRMKKVGRDNIKEERELSKKRYTDPTYFGHKRKPKIRPVGKKKFCKECGLKH